MNKLQLNKQVIAQLGNQEMSRVQGGSEFPECTIPMPPTQIGCNYHTDWGICPPGNTGTGNTGTGNTGSGGTNSVFFTECDDTTITNQ